MVPLQALYLERVFAYEAGNDLVSRNSAAEQALTLTSMYRPGTEFFFFFDTL